MCVGLTVLLIVLWQTDDDDNDDDNFNATTTDLSNYAVIIGYTAGWPSWFLLHYAAGREFQEERLNNRSGKCGTARVEIARVEKGEGKYMYTEKPHVRCMSRSSKLRTDGELASNELQAEELSRSQIRKAKRCSIELVQVRELCRRNQTDGTILHNHYILFAVNRHFVLSY